jgi:hypothetical protein
MVAFYGAGETLPLAGPDDVYVIANRKHIHGHLVTLGDFRVLLAELTQKAQRRQVVALQVP